VKAGIVGLCGLNLSLVLILGSCDNTNSAKPAMQSSGNAANIPGGECRAILFEEDEFTACLAVPGQHEIITALNAKDGVPYRSLSAYNDALGEKSKAVAFAMNAGMFDEDGRPIGYYVENGERKKTLNQNAGGGNFHLLPNGVFSVEPDGWHIRTADDFAGTVTKRPTYATQSGPMLLIQKKLHPKIAENGTSVNIRNAIGVDAKGRAYFVISQSAVSFGRMARMMRDKLACEDALYLDGSVSALWYPAGDRLDGLASLGPLIVAVKTARETK
jgi:uncharacterized protein YigE (DUF2233 family)